MIVWNEQQPDFYRKPVQELLTGLSFTAACAVILGNGDRPRVAASRTVLDAIWAHLAERRIEMGGLLIGRIYDLDDSGKCFAARVEDYARADAYNGTGVSLRMDPGVWEAARKKLHDGQSVIGWYHSHPNLGAFFSGTDRGTQLAFFSHPHSLGLVVDPIRREERWFIGPDSIELDAQQILRI